ncbi:MAG: hypothetical protein QXW50_03725 [Nitrososphaerota archaeon]
MRIYTIVSCPKCGEYRIVKRQKTFKCFSCGEISTLRAELAVFSSDSAVEAMRKLANLKLMRRRSGGPVTSLSGAR